MILKQVRPLFLRVPLVTVVCTALSALTLTTLSACNRDPDYPAVQPNAPAERREHASAFALDVANYTEFKEGEAKIVALNARVPSPGRPVVAVEGLPPGAVFDAKKNEISWKPGFDAADDAANPAVTSRDYLVRLVLRSDADPVTQEPFSIHFLVKNVSRTFSLAATGGSSFPIPENKDFVMTFDVKSEDYPNGPFRIALEAFPAGAQLVPVSATRYQVKYRPGITEVTSKDKLDFSCDCFMRRVQPTVTVVNPRGETVQMKVDWDLRDERMAPVFAGPAQVTMGFDGIFVISASDANLEVAPTLKMTRDPGVGFVSSTNTVNGLQTTLQVEWKGVPANYAGTVQSFNFEACVPAARGGPKCAPFAVRAQISGAGGAAPTLDRTQWPVGTQLFALANQELRVAMPIKELFNPAVAPIVRIKSSVVADQVSHTGKELVFKSAQAGVRQINIEVVSSNGAAVSESFALEVLPAGWARRLVAGPNPATNEAKRNVTLFDPAQAMPVAGGGEHVLVYRELLMVGSEALDNDAERAAVETASTKIRDLVVASPHAAKFTTETLAELQKLGVEIKTVAGSASGTEVAPLPNSGLPVNGIPTPIKVSLRGTLTSASVDVGQIVLSPTSTCQPLLNFRKALQPDMLAAAFCRRPGGGALLVSGFEWGDLDSNLQTSQWLKTLLQKMQTMVKP